jgi:L,D-transpeptidase YcbB
MAKLRLDHLLISTAITVVLSAATPVRAAPVGDVIAAAIPQPEPADVAPLTPADIVSKRTPDASNSAVAPASTQPAQDTAAVIPTDPVGAKIKELLASKGDRMFASKRERSAVEAFYAAHNYDPSWESAGAMSARAQAAVAYLATVDSEGLDPAEYPIPNFKAATSPDQLAEADLRMTATLLTYARHAQNGRINPSRVVPEVAYTGEAVDPADVLAKLGDSRDIAATLADFNPPMPQYKALKAKLVELRGGKSGAGAARIAAGPVLKLGKSPVHDARVPALRQHLGLPAKDDDVYDRALASAVAAFQKEHELRGNGDLTSATVDGINGPRRDRSHEVDTIIANMERWRWLSRDLGRAYSMLNIPDYTIKVVKDGETVWTTRAVVGKPSKPTPLLTETMKYITINPTWNVPPSIVYHEYLPVLAQDPTALARYGLHVGHNSDGSVHIWQPPGDNNALGRIRFNFPNKFLVYQHDTPDKDLFALSKRAFSHGCQRVQDPVKYAEVMSSLGGATETYSQDRIRHMIASFQETDIKFTTPIPVHLTYQTAFVDDAGKLQFREDIYGRDAQLLAALKSSERAAPREPVERQDTPMAQQSQPPSSSTSGHKHSNSRVASGSRSYGGQGFFQSFFGGGRPPAAIPGRQLYYR